MLEYTAAKAGDAKKNNTDAFGDDEKSQGGVSTAYSALVEAVSKFVASAAGSFIE